MEALKVPGGEQTPTENVKAPPFEASEDSHHELAGRYITYAV